MLMLDQIAQMAQEVGWQLPNEILPGPVCYQSYGEEENKLDAAFVAYLACSQFLVSRYIEASGVSSSISTTAKSLWPSSSTSSPSTVAVVVVHCKN